MDFYSFLDEEDSDENNPKPSSGDVKKPPDPQEATEQGANCVVQ